MSSLLVFNHHSLPYKSVEAAVAAVPEFIRVCLKAQNLGFSTILVDESIDKTWFRLELAADYYWQDWYQRNNNPENKDLLRAFRSIATKQPLFSFEDTGDDLELFEVSLSGNSAYEALRSAAWYDAPVSSFPARPPWDSHPLPVKIQTMGKDAEVNTLDECIPNYYSLEILQSCEPDILRQRDAGIKTGSDIFNNREEFYPQLVFCGKTREQLIGWSLSATLLGQVKESLNILNKFAELWKNSSIAAYSDGALQQTGLNHKVSGESPSVLNHPGLRQEREFWLPHGIKATFEKHIKLSKGFRIHFYPDPETKIIYIGYIGRHLRLH